MTPKQASAAYERETLERGHIDVVADLRSQNEALKKELVSPILVNLNRLVDGIADAKAKDKQVLAILKRLSALLAEKDVTKRTYYEEMALEGIDDALKILEPKP